MKQVRIRQPGLIGVAWYGLIKGKRDYVTGGFIQLVERDEFVSHHWTTIYMRSDAEDFFSSIDTQRFEGLWLRHPRRPTRK